MITVEQVDARVLRMETRLPFRYGIAEMTVVPHVVVEVVLRDTSGRSAKGWASEQLPPKWFTKDPETSFSEDLEGLVEVVEQAVARATGVSARSVFDMWSRLDADQSAWASQARVPGLLAGLGTALVERAVIDAACRLDGTTFVRALHSGLLGFEPGWVHPELEGVQWRACLPDRPAERIAVRHTVGFADALSADEVTDDPGDGLPVDLEAVVAKYGVSYFKVKTAGDAVADRARLARLFSLCAAEGIRPHLTVDGNESMRDGPALLAWMRELFDDPRVGPALRESLVAVEQPVHRDRAFSPGLAEALTTLRAEGVAVIIDESDEDTTAVRRAMDLGYAGGTYKGCKGVFRGLANAVLVHRRGAGGVPALMTAEDLTTLPPLTVAQDLVVSAAMGLRHIERNGHHYFGRLVPFSASITDDALASHPDLYAADPDVGARLRIERGELDVTSALAAPFGFAPSVDIASLDALSLETARAAAQA